MVQDDSSERRSPSDEDGDATQTASSSRGTPGGLPIRCPHCHHPFEIVIDAPLTDILCDSCGAQFSLAEDGSDTLAAESITRIEHFELVERIGIGSFGTVWKARDTKLQRTVAVKIPRLRHLDSEESQKFLREARSAAQLDHPHVIRVHEVGRSGETFYLVTEYVRGIPLSDWLTQHRITGREAAMLLRTMAEAVHHAHQAGVIHRDLKPQNILIDAKGEPHVMDFGLARRQAADVTMTVDGQVLGTPAYMPPEQALGEGHKADCRSDVYSLGVIFFQLLTGELPFRGNVSVIIHQVLHDEPPSPRKLNGTVHRDLETICLKCLEKDPDRRYASAQHLADDLDRFTRGVAVKARPISPLQRGWRWCKRNSIVAGLLGTVFLLLLTGIGVSSYFGFQANRYARRADRNAKEVTATLYHSLVRGSQATRVARVQGYRDDAWDFLKDARSLNTPNVDLDELRQEAIAGMGDFVGLRPVVCEGFANAIVAVAITPDARQLAVGLDDGTIWLCDAATGQQQTELTKHAAAVIGLRFAATDGRLISADRHGTVRIWRQEAAQAWHIEKTLHLIEQPSGSTEQQPTAGESTERAQPSPVLTWLCHITSDGTCIAMVRGETIDIWSLPEGKRLARLPMTGNGVSIERVENIALDPTKKLLAGAYVSDSDGPPGLAVWDVGTEQIRSHIELDLGSAYPHSIAFSSDSKQLAVGFDQELAIYETETFRQLMSKRLDATKALAFSPDGQFLANVNIRGRVTIWNVATNRKVATLANWRKRLGTEDLVFSADGSHLAASNAQGVRVWWLTGAGERMALPGHTGGVPSVAFSPTDKLLVSAGKDRRVRFWDSVTGVALPGIALPGEVQSVTFSADGELLAIAYWTTGKGIALVDVATKQILLTQGHPLEWVSSLQFYQRNGTLFLAAAGGKGVVIWQIETPSDNRSGTAAPLSLKQIARPYSHRSIHIAVSPDSRWMAWVHGDSTIDLWDVQAAELRPLHTPRLNQGWHGLAFFPDSRRLTFVTDRGVADVWDVVQDKKRAQLGELGELIFPHIALSADGRWLAGVMASDAIGVWNTTSEKRFFVLRPERSSVMSIAWNRQADKLAVGLADGGISLWDIVRIRAELAQLKLDWTGECPGEQEGGD